MRFAYIDSNGNEVPIPGVDALALRIELGAISEETQLYDAQADQWGPAHTHEIYHTLARASESDDGFIAPPPVAPAPVTTPVAAEDAEDAGEAELSEAAVAEPPATEPVEEPTPATPDDLTLAELPAVEEEAAEPDPEPDPQPDPPAEGSGELTLADPSPSEEDAVPSPPSAEDSADAPMELDLASAMEAEETAPLDLSAPVADDVADEPEGLGGGFDFGGMDGGLELEEAFEAPDESAPMDFGAGADGGIELESAMDFGAGGFEMDDGGALDLETPMSDFSPEDPPSWMDDDGGAPDEGEVLDFSSVGGESEDEVSLRDRRTPKNQPSRPKRRRRSLAAPLIGAVAIVAVGVGVYAAWPAVTARLSAGPEDVEPAVFIPQLSAELMPQMREAADASLATIFQGLRQEWGAAGGVAAPPSEWLAGVYLARASDYSQAEVFWAAMGDLLDSAQGIDVADFDATFAAEMARRGSAEADADAMRARADSGFVAAADARAATYAQMETLIGAALRLHQFLLANEANIEYVPASTVTTDPVLEVNPASAEIGDAMGDLIDAVTGALSALGYRDQVTADGLWAVLLERVQETGIQ